MIENIINDKTKDLDFVKKVVIDNISFSYITNSKIHGFGLFANSKIQKNTILGILDGQVMDWNNYNNLLDFLKNEFGIYKNYIFMEWNALDKKTLLVRPFRTKYSYINHSEEPNVEIKYNPIRIETIREIIKDEEILINYKNEPLNDDYLHGYGKSFL